MHSSSDNTGKEVSVQQRRETSVMGAVSCMLCVVRLHGIPVVLSADEHADQTALGYALLYY